MYIKQSATVRRYIADGLFVVPVRSDDVATLRITVITHILASLLRVMGKTEIGSCLNRVVERDSTSTSDQRPSKFSTIRHEQLEAHLERSSILNPE